ncbi:metal dependent phosphohydrolase [Flammeovirgaceae bacterium 311]|nr:metal dependent phosphohydrolase [Flammeovirgaceae bacterium 311]
MNFQKAKAYAITRLQQELPENLYYHGLHHTLDVCQSIEKLAIREHVQAEDLVILRTAGLYHDIGFVEQYQCNEPIACRIVRESLPYFDYTSTQIDIICKIILSTQIPQRPHTHLEMIMCDADLDYLGRDDFFEISRTLLKEWIEFGIINSTQEWNRKQISFFQQHHYYTLTARNLREPLKLKHLHELQRVLTS